MSGQSKVEGRHYRTGKPVTVWLEEGRISRICSLEADRDDLPWIAPGLVDLQINGYSGIDFNTLPLTEEAVHDVTRKIAALGVTSYYPTVITNSGEEIETLVKVIASACSSDPLTDRCIAGIHVEGPFISPHDGARGAHSQAFVTAPDLEWVERWQKAANGKIRIITMSPEWDNSSDFIQSCVRMGITVSIGHTAASPEQIREAVAAGASMSTHLGNGAAQLLPRHPNFIWEQLASEELFPCAIADGFHLPESVLKVFMKAKPEELMIVSDAVYLSGMEPGRYETHIGGSVILTPEGRLHIADHPQMLAGSAQMLPFNIEHLVNTGLCEAKQAWEMASLRPAAFMGLACSSGLTENAPADLVVHRWAEGKLDVRQVYKSGSLVD